MVTCKFILKYDSRNFVSKVVVEAVQLYSYTLTSSTAADFLEGRDSKISYLQKKRSEVNDFIKGDLFDLVGRGLELFQRSFAIYRFPNTPYIKMPVCLLIKIVKMLKGFQFLEIFN